MRGEDTNLLRPRPPLKLRFPIFDFFQETLGLVVRNRTGSTFHLHRCSTQLTLLSSDCIVLRGDDSVTSGGPYLKLSILMPQVRNFLVKECDEFLGNFWVNLVLTLVHRGWGCCQRAINENRRYFLNVTRAGVLLRRSKLTDQHNSKLDLPFQTCILPISRLGGFSWYSQNPLTA